MKLITLKELHMHNWMGYQGDCVLEFEDKDIVGILAEYESDPVRSNRGGKTSILEAIGYNLTGISRAKDESKLIHHGEKEMYVKAVYTDGDKDYTIKRGRDHKSKGILELDWIQKVSEVEAEIEKLFGISERDFHLTSYFKQADTEGFMKKTASEKAKFLMQWIDNEHWKEKEKKVNEDRIIVKQKLRDNENLKKALESSLEIDESLFSLKVEIEKETENLDKEKNEVSAFLAETKEKIKNLDTKKAEVSSQIRKLQEESEDIKETVSKFESDETNYQNCRKEYARLKKQLEGLNTQLDEKTVVAKIDKLKARRHEINNTLETSKKYSKGICPVLQESCDRLKFDADAVDALNTELLSINGQLKELEQVVSNHRIKADLTSKMETQQERGKRFKDRLTKKPELEQRLEEIEQKIPELTSLVKALNLTDLLNHKQQLTETFDDLVQKLKDNGKKILDMEIRIEEAKRAKEKIDTVVEANAKLQQKLSLLNYSHFTFKTIPALEVENSFQEIEDNINYILDHIMNGVQVSFAPDKELKSLEPVCDCGFQFPKGFRGNSCPDCESPRQNRKKEEITFKILENGVESDFEMDSGGGKQVISYAVRIALTMLKRAQRKCNLNILFLDEVDSALDPYLAGQIVSSITNFLTKKLGYQQVFLVSHKEQIKSAIPHIIKVTKHDTHATARFM